MDARIHRCCFCGQTYTYLASGDGCLDPTNDRKYCPRCKEIINKALEEQVPKTDRIISCPKEVEKFSDELLNKMLNLKNEYLENRKGFFSSVMSVSCSLQYDNIEIYNIDKKRYYIAYNNDTDDKHYYIDYEYCKATKEFKEIFFNYNDNKNVDTYSKGCNIVKILQNAVCEKRGLDKPLGKIYFNMSEWEIIHTNIEDKNYE